MSLFLHFFSFSGFTPVCFVLNLGASICAQGKLLRDVVQLCSLFCFIVSSFFVCMWCVCVCVWRVFWGIVCDLCFISASIVPTKVVVVGSLSSWWSVGAAAWKRILHSPHGERKCYEANIINIPSHVPCRCHPFLLIPNFASSEVCTNFIQFLNSSECLHWMRSFRTELVSFGSHRSRHQCVAITATVAQDEKDDRSTQTLRTRQNTANASVMEIRMNACQLHQL